MGEYKTIVIVQDSLFETMEKYRFLLERSEFGTMLKSACFVNENSAGELSSAELKTCIFLYGLLNKEEHTRLYNAIEESKSANAQCYMLFCQKQYNEEPIAQSRPVKGQIRHTYDIGIIESDEYKEAEENRDRFREELRCLRLLSLALAIAKHNEGPSQAGCSFYYATAKVELNFQNIYLAVLYMLLTYAEDIKLKRQTIRAAEAEIERLEKQKPKKCVGIYGTDKMPSFKGMEAGSFKDNMEKMRRNMEMTYTNSKQTMENAIASKIKIARTALAAVEKQEVLDSEQGEAVDVSQSPVVLKYMTFSDVKDSEVSLPEDLLQRPDEKASFNAECLHRIFPLAKEFEAKEKPHLGKALFAALCFALLFFVLVGFVYGTRVIKSGLQDVFVSDIVLLTVMPIALVLLIGIIGFFVQWMQHRLCKNVFKEIYMALQAYLAAAASLCNSVENYINTYLTVYYNYHIRKAKIEKLHDKILYLKTEIEKIEKKAEPLNALAELIQFLSEGKVSSVSSDKTGVGEMISQEDIKQIIQNAQTEFSPESKGTNTQCVWIKGLSYGIGNMN